MMSSSIDALLITSVDSGTNSLQMYDVVTGANIKTYKGIPAGTKTLSVIGKADKFICSQRNKPFLQAWYINQHEAMQLRLVVPGRPTVMVVNLNGPKYAAVGIGEKIYVYHLASGQIIGIIKHHYQTVSSLCFTPCGNYLASGGEDGFVYLWCMANIMDNLSKQDSSSIQPHYILGQHNDKVSDLFITATGMKGLLFSSSLDNTIRVYDLLTGKMRHTFVSSCDVLCVIANSLGSLLFFGCSDGKIRNTSLLPAPPVGEIQMCIEGDECHEKAVRCLAVNSSGGILVSGGDEGDVKVWSVSMTHDTFTENFRMGAVHLALQRIIHSGHGPITNMKIIYIDKQVLDGINLPSWDVLSAFSTDPTVGVVNSPISVPVCGAESHNGPTREEALNLSTLADEDRLTQSEVEETEVNSKELEKLHLKLSRLKKLNSDLYKFALKSIKN